MILDSLARAILTAFAESYPSSAHYRGGRKLRLGNWSRRLPKIEKEVEEREAFLAAVEALESEKVISVKWERFRVGESVEALYLEDPEKLYEMIGATAPWDRREELLSALGRAPWTDPGLAELSDRLQALLEEHHLLPISEATELTDLGRILLLSEADTAGTPLRALSIRLFGDSKRLERLLPAADKLSTEADGDAVSARLGLKRSYPEVSFSLFGSASLPAGPWQLSGEPLTAPLQTIRAIGALHLRHPERTDSPWVLSVENKESFYAVTEAARRGWESLGESAPPSAVVYTAGHPGDAVRALLVLLAREASAVLHFGDMDPDGLLILQELAAGTGIAVRPFSMDEATYRRYLPYGRPLPEAALARLKDVHLPNLGALAAAIGETGIGVEQEVIPVGF